MVRIRVSVRIRVRFSFSDKVSIAPHGVSGIGYQEPDVATSSNN